MAWIHRLINTIKYTSRWLWISIQLIPALWRLFKLRPPRITFFGGSKLTPTDRYTKEAEILAHGCAEHGMTIITGGGGGIMQAAAQGVNSSPRASSQALGITIHGLPEYKLWPTYASLTLVDNLIVRKWLMLNFSAACVIFPGGIGTYNEFAEVLTLIDIQLLKSIPILLYGKEFWAPFLTWLNEEGVGRGFINPHIFKTFIIVDDTNQAIQRLIEGCIHEPTASFDQTHGH